MGFLGTLGMAHALDAVLDAAALLRERSDIVFLLVGSGASVGALADRAGQLGLEQRGLSAPPSPNQPCLICGRCAMYR